MARLPTPGADIGTWGSVLNEFLTTSHNQDGTLKHQALNAKNYGATGNGTTDDTIAIQAWLAACKAQHKAGYLPTGIYLVSQGLVLPSVEIFGDYPAMSGVTYFGHAYWNDKSRYRGSWIKSTLTSGYALRVEYVSGSSFNGKPHLSKIGIVGPGSGTSTGLYLDSNVKFGYYGDICIVNFSKGLEIKQTYDNEFRGLHIRGCDIGIYLFGNQNTFYQTEIQACNTHAIKFSNGVANAFFGGVTEVNAKGGTAFKFENFSQGNSFYGWYFEDIGCALGFDIQYGSDENAFYSSHFAGDNTFNIAGSRNAIFFPQMGTKTTLTGTRNFLFGYWSAGYIVDNQKPNNVVIDVGSSEMYGPFSLRVPSGKEIFLESVGSGNSIKRDTPTGDTVISSASGQTKVLQRLAAVNGVTTKTKAGVVTDADFGSKPPPDGTIAVDTTNSKIYVRINGVWKSASLT